MEDDSLVASIEQLREALAADFSARGREWAQALVQALGRAEDGLRKHLAAAESREGPSAEGDKPQQSFARQAHDVYESFSKLLGQSGALRRELQRQATDPPAAPEARALRGRAERFLAGLRHAKEAETVLILDRVNTEVGVGD
jgi:hypothetical protein